MRPEPRFLALVALLLCIGCTPAAELSVSDARIRELIPGQDRTVAYFTLVNRRATSIILIGVETDAARSVEMHTTLQDGDVLRMRRLDSVEVPAGGAVRFEPGGNHLMLFGVNSLGERTELRLHFADSTSLPVTFERIGIDAVNG